MEESLSMRMYFVSLPGYEMKATCFPKLPYDLEFGSTPRGFQDGIESFMLDTFEEHPSTSGFVNVRCSKVDFGGWREFVAVFEYDSRNEDGESVVVEGCYRHFDPMTPKDGLH